MNSPVIKSSVVKYANTQIFILGYVRMHITLLILKCIFINHDKYLRTNVVVENGLLLQLGVVSGHERIYIFFSLLYYDKKLRSVTFSIT